MEMPREFMRLVNDYNPDNLNMMNAIDLLKLIHFTRDMAEALEGLINNGFHENTNKTDVLNALNSIKKFQEWKL